MHTVRRIVTTTSAAGGSRVLQNGQAPRTLTVLTELWRTGATDSAMEEDASLGSDRIEPPAGGTVFRYFEIAPAAEQAHLTEAQRECEAADWFQAMGASHLRVDTRRDPNMHLSHTTDYVILLKGEITLVLDEEEVRLRPFDAVIQRSTNHAWRNDGHEPALLAAVLVDGPAAPVVSAMSTTRRSS